MKNEQLPSFIEDHISQIPAIQLLINMGWQYLTPEEALVARGGRTSNVLLEEILKTQLQKINSIHYREREYPFSENNINAAILAVRDLPIQEGFINANQHFYDLITLGRSFEQRVEGDKKSFSFKYIDWDNPENNVFHVTEEFSVLRYARHDHYRPDIVLFVNGIPFVIIECKSPKVKDPIDKAIEQNLRNQQEDGIRALYQYSSLILAIATNDGRYATTGTAKEFWSSWREMHPKHDSIDSFESELHKLKHKPLDPTERNHLFQERFRYVLKYFDSLDAQEKVVTAQDRTLFSLCQPERLLDLVFNFTVYDDGIKKIARYQQYFAVKTTLNRVSHIQSNGTRRGGVIWHTQGSGKSLTMVMLAQMIAKHSSIPNPRIVLVTDRIDLDDQITETFKKCEMPVRQATKGASTEIKKKLGGARMTEKELEKLEKDRSLLALLAIKEDHIITTIINKFEAAVKGAPVPFESPNIFVLIDEGHRSQYGTFNVKMRQIFPNACFIAFTGTPLMKKEKSTATKFGGIITEAIYTIRQAVEDGAVVPLLYEGRHNLFDVNEKPLNKFFDKVSEPLSDYGKAALKKKFSTKNALNQADQVIYERAMDISDHFVDNFQGTGLKGQLVAPRKEVAIKYKQYLDEIGRVRSEVIMSPPDQREGTEDPFAATSDTVVDFWKSLMDKYGNPKHYEKSIVNGFKKKEEPEILIVVDKLLTGFDAPCNSVMYLTRPLKEHGLLQAIARVNRLFPGKEFGIIIDYFGNLEHLDTALEVYTLEGDYDKEDLQGTVTNVMKEVEKLPQVHSELWDIFKEVQNKYDEPAYEELLSDEEIRYQFYEKVSEYSRLLKLSLSSLEFTNTTPQEQIDKYKQDAKFFLSLRASVKRRYFDTTDYKEFEAQVKKLIDRHITTEGEVLKITNLVDIFDQEAREAEVEKMVGKAAKADHISSRTLKAISVKMEEDPVFYQKLADLIKQTIADYHAERISEAEFLIKAKSHEEDFFKGKSDDLPTVLSNKPIATAYYNWVTKELSAFGESDPNHRALAADLAVKMDHQFKEMVYADGILLVDWQNNPDIEGRIRISLDDVIFDFQSQNGLQFGLNEIDELINEVLKVAKVRYE